MENPFKKLFSSGSAEKEAARMDEEKAKRIQELREWRKSVEMGMQMEPHREDAQVLERIDRELAELEGRGN